MENKAINTQYGTIHGRDALIIKSVNLNMYPMNISINASLDLSFCQPIKETNKEVIISFLFKEIKSLNITMIDESDYQLIKKSSFDFLPDEKGERYILSTYDHVFDITGKCEVIYE